MSRDMSFLCPETAHCRAHGNLADSVAWELGNAAHSSATPGSVLVSGVCEPRPGELESLARKNRGDAMDTGRQIVAILIIVAGLVMIVVYQRWKKASHTQRDIDSRFRDDDEPT
jgi:hypothetical protein